MSAYHPILKWRKRELAALGHLSLADRENVLPVFELPPTPWDFDLGRPVDEALSPLQGIGTQLAGAWGARACAIDAPHLSGADTNLPCVVLDTVFYQARINSCNAIPVIGLDRSDAYLRAASHVLQTDGRGVCIRVRQTHLDADLDARLSKLLAVVGAVATQCHILVDFEANAMQSVNSYSDIVCNSILRLPRLMDWRSLALCCSAMPASLPFDLYWPYGTVPRYDWLGYLCAATTLKRYGLDVAYADYGVHHPNAEMVDPRLVGRELALVYATSESWFIYASCRSDSRGIREIARQWQHHASFRRFENTSFDPCWADIQIKRLMDTDITDRELSLWQKVSTNRHLSVTARQMQTTSGCDQLLQPSIPTRSAGFSASQLGPQ